VGHTDGSACGILIANTYPNDRKESDHAQRGEAQHDSGETCSSPEGCHGRVRQDDQRGEGRTQEGQPGPDEALQPSRELAAVVGSKPLPRAEVVSKVWDYTKKHKLQDPQNKREIMADEKLQAVFGKNRVTMFEMNKHLAQHLTQIEQFGPDFGVIPRVSV